MVGDAPSPDFQGWRDEAGPVIVLPQTLDEDALFRNLGRRRPQPATAIKKSPLVDGLRIGVRSG